MNKLFKDIKVGDKLSISEESFLTNDFKREIIVTNIANEINPNRLLFTIKFENSSEE